MRLPSNWAITRCIRNARRLRVSNRAIVLKRAIPPRDELNSIQSYLALNLCASSSIFSFTPTSEPPSVSLFFSVLFGLPIALWAYKCLTMVLFQRKIIYMGYIPPGTRQEELSDVPELPKLHKDYSFEETRITSSDRVKLSALIMNKKITEKPDCVVIYLQGNAGNPLHRIPVFTSLLSSTAHTNPVILAPAPRSYWSSSNRAPTEAGLLGDYHAALHYAARRWPSTPLVLYGHSLGGAVAVCLLASLDSEIQEELSKEEREMRDALRGLILENPFASIPGMVHALYPQRWLPYRHLAPLAWDKWDALAAMRASASSYDTSVVNDIDVGPGLTHSPGETKPLFRLAQNMLVLISSRDEVVPPSMGHALFDARCLKAGNLEEDRARLVEIDGALHEDAWRQRQWKKDIGRYLEDITRSGAR